MQLVTQQGLTTWERGESKTTVDLTFISQRLYPALVSCNRSDDLDTNSDHYPIRTEILTATLQRENNRRKQWKKADWPSIKAHVKGAAQRCPDPKTCQEIDQNIRIATKAIQEAIDKAGGHMGDAARILGLHRPNLYRKMRMLSMEAK